MKGILGYRSSRPPPQDVSPEVCAVELVRVARVSTAKRFRHDADDGGGRMSDRIKEAATLFAVTCAVLVCAAPADATPHFALKAVKVNDEVLYQPEHTVSIVPGDVVVAEIHISNWAEMIPGGIGAYSAEIGRI